MALSKIMEELAIEMHRVEGYDKGLAAAIVTWLKDPKDQQEYLDWVRAEEAPNIRTASNKLSEILHRGETDAPIR